MPDIKNDYNVVWQPQPGSQSLCMSCPADIIISHSSRGSGKTDAQLMRFRKNVGIGFGRYWRGVIFDREYKNLDDLVSKSMRWFPEFKDGARFLSGKSDYRWIWPTGEELLFRAIKTPSDYWSFHGQEFCLAEFEIVTIEGRGNVPLATVTVGEKILTPNGFKRVTRVFPTQMKECNTVHVWDERAQYVGSHVQSVEHKLLSGDLQSFCRVDDKVLSPNVLDLSTEHSYLLNIFSLYLQLVLRQDTSELLPPSPVQGTQSCSDLDGLRGQSYDVAFRDLRQGFLRHLERYGSRFQELLSHLLQADGIRPQVSIQHQVLSESCEPLLVRNLVEKAMRLDQMQLQGFLRQVLCYGLDCDRHEYVLCYLEKAIGSQLHCSGDHGQYDELLRLGVDSAQDTALLSHDVLELVHSGLNVDALAHADICNRLSGASVYIHPYSHEKTESVLPLVSGKSVAVSFGIAPTIDITVEDCNCYITTNTGTVSSNCFIGWNELTKYPTDELFDLMLSCNRSSFRPEDHVVRDESGRVIYTPPKMPLEIYCTTNPSGPGHGWVRKRFIAPAPAGKMQYTETEVFNPQTQRREIVRKSQVHIFGSYKENKYLPPEYVAELEKITDPNKRRAWLYGDWDITSGGMFDDVWDANFNVVCPFPIPNSWRIDRSFDYGSSKPFSVGWWAESDGCDIQTIDGKWTSTVKGDLFRIGEWYGCTEKANQGLRMLAGDIARGIVEREMAMGIHSKVRPGPADNSIWDSVNGNSIAAAMEKPVNIGGKMYPGVRWVRSDKAKGSRKDGWQKVRQFLQSAHNQFIIAENGEKIPVPRSQPGLFCFNTCRHFMEILPILPRDEVDDDDVDTDSEDHIGDEVRYKILSTNTGARGGRTSGTA